MSRTPSAGSVEGGWGDENEHFCTLFDLGYLPQALSLHDSLMKQDPTAVLWALCMDDEALDALTRLNLERTVPVALDEVESHFGDTLISAKADRTQGEYCWTLSPFLPQFVLDTLGPTPSKTRRVTYVDADCFFFGSPQRILAHFSESGADVMITPHAYAPEYDQSETSGRFCVHFVTFRDTEAGRAVLSRWQEQCAEWCYARFEPGRFGDQKYLDDWPDVFGRSVYVLEDLCLTLAPWNVESLLAQGCATESPGEAGGLCMYHFHGLRFESAHRVRLYMNYRISPATVRRIYKPYLDSLERSLRIMTACGIAPRVTRLRLTPGERYSRLVYRMRRELRTARIRY